MSSLPPTEPSSRRSLWRWSVALLATVLMVVVGSGLVAFAQSGAGASRGPVFLPAETSVYVEGRLDMPDGQADAMAGFLSAFPGFADTGSFMTILGGALDGLVSDTTGGSISYSEDLAPFLTGEIGLGVMDFAGMLAGEGDPDVLVGAAVSDAEAADAFIDEQLSSGADVVEEPYGGTSILSDPLGGMALAVVDDWILMAPTVDLVKAGIDTLSGDLPSLADDPDFSASWSRVPAAHVVAAYMDFESFGPLMDMAMSAAEGETGMAMDLSQVAAQLPQDMVMYLSAEADRMTLQAYITPGDETPAMALGESDLAARFPADTQIYLETRELGAMLQTALGGLLETMDEETAAQMAPLEDMFGVPLPELLDFVSDASLGAALSSDGLWLGMAGEVSDEAIATDRVERILSIVRLLGAGMGGEDAPQISVDETTIDGTTVTTVTLPIDEVTGGQLPVTIPDTLSIAVDDGTLLIGLGDFVENALTGAETDSLAASPGYVDALGEDTSNSGVLYVNVGSLLSVLDPLLATMAPEWADIAPYATALDRFIAVGTVDEEVISARMSVIVAP